MAAKSRLLGCVALTQTLLVAGCGILPFDACIYELRGVEVRGSVAQTGTDPIAAQLSESEQRDSDPSKELYWAITGPPSIKPHITQALLRDAAAPTTPRFTFPLSPADRPTIAEGAVDTRSGTNLNGFFDLLAQGRAVVELQTDLPDQALISIPLAVAQKSDWYRPRCG